jgi:hypothetical protein
VRALQFFVECVLIATIVGMGVSIGVALIERVTRRWTDRFAPSRRSDLFFVAALLPAMCAIAVTTAAAGPSLLALFDLHHDHCGTHLHHAHLCLLHDFDIPALRIGLGVAALTVLALQAIRFGVALFAQQRTLSALEALGRESGDGRFSIVRLPGEPRLCHAVGVHRRRVLLSDSLAHAISECELKAALAHEEAHHDRWDGLAALLLRTSAILSAPYVMRSVIAAHRVAIEEAADSRAARIVGSPRLVAEAILAVARVQVLRPDLLQHGITSGDIERRVTRLLDGADDRPSVGLFGVASVCLFASMFILLGAHPIHHAVESLLHLI